MFSRRRGHGAPQATAGPPRRDLTGGVPAPLGVSQYRLAKDTSVPPRRINGIVRGSRSISADTALRLAQNFGTSERFWLNLQARYDLEVEKDRLGDRLRREVKVLEAASA